MELINYIFAKSLLCKTKKARLVPFLKIVLYGLDTEPERNRNRNRNRNLSKVGTGTGSVKHSYDSTTGEIRWLRYLKTVPNDP
jgi:hypothetical protein